MDRAALNIILTVVMGCFGLASAQGQCDLGKNYAFFFGVADYEANTGWPDLKYPVQNIESIAALLHDYYSFDTTLYRNPTTYEIDQAIKDLQSKEDWGPHDQLMLFFSGHGQKGGYFIPRDCRKGWEHREGIYFNADFQDRLDAIGCRHQFVVIDACYSGSFFTAQYRSGGGEDDWKKGLIEAEADKNLKILCSHQARRTRLAMTSASSNEVAPDASKLFRAFRDLLIDFSNREEILYSANIYTLLKKEASMPIFNTFHPSNDAASSFLFIPPKVREVYETADPCPIDPVACAPRPKDCLACPMDPEEQVYDVMRVNGTLWMTENLDFANYGKSHCINCEEHGRLYNWQQAKEACAALGKGWRLPTIEEWQELSLEEGSGYGVMGIGVSGKGNAKRSFKKIKESRWNLQFGGIKSGRKAKQQGEEGWYWSRDLTNGDLDAFVFNFSKYGVIETLRDVQDELSCRCVRE